MSKNKIGPKLILGVFIIVICFSWFFWFFLEKYVDSSNNENREMHAKPELKLDNYTTFATEYNEYFNDNLPFRNNLITINSAIDYFIFNVSASDYVIPGEEEWLFYSREDDGNPISCYQGTNLISDELLETIAQNCVAQRDFLKSQGKEFVIFIAPNKERIYSEFMPERYGKPSDIYGAKQIVDYLRENTDLRVVYPYEELMSAKEKIKENIYYKTDTHWNWIGGYIGASALLKELDVEMPDIEQLEIIHGDSISGDLATMLNLSKQLKSTDIEYTVKGYDTHEMQQHEYDFNTLYSYTANNADPRKIYVTRDSFSTYISPYVGSQFSECYLRHHMSYTYDDFLEKDPDIYVYETVERYVLGLANFSVK